MQKMHITIDLSVRRRRTDVAFFATTATAEKRIIIGIAPATYTIAGAVFCAFIQRFEKWLCKMAFPVLYK